MRGLNLLMVSLALLGTCSNSSAGEKIFLKNRLVQTGGLQMRNLRTVSGSEWIVQFKSAPTEAERRFLQGRGFEVFSYMPDDAYLVRGSAQQAAALLQNSQIQAVEAFRPEDKLEALSPVSVFSGQKFERVIVKLYKAEELAAFQTYLKSFSNSVRILEAQRDTLVLAWTQALRMQIAASPMVEHIQSYVEMKPMHMVLEPESQAVMLGSEGSDLSGYETGTKIMNFEPLWAAGLKGQGQIVAMADTGLDNGQISGISADFQGAVKSGHIFGLFAKTWEDPMGHGTHVAGSILGRGTASNGVLHGGAYEAQLVAEGMWSPMLNNLSVPSKLEDLFNKAYVDGARVHSNSWGAARNFGAYDNFAVAVDTWMYNNPDMLVVFAAGNSGVDKDKDGRIDPSSLGSPGTAKNVLTVGASENLLDKGGIQVPIGKLRSSPENWPAEPIISSRLSDHIDGLAMFSSRGPTQDGRLKPDVVAPGTNILSTRSHVKGADPLWGAYNDDYVYSGGTSMSTPLVSGATALLRQLMVEKLNLASPSAALMKAALMHTAVDMFPGQYGAIGASRGQEILTRRPNMDEGFGRVDVGRFLGLLTNSTRLVDEKVGLTAGEVKTHEYSFSGGQLLLNLVYTDAPASANAAKALVNDLDVTVTLPNGQVLQAQDRVNNHEVIEVSGVPAGVIKVAVKGEKVPQGKSGRQAYAMVISVK